MSTPRADIRVAAASNQSYSNTARGDLLFILENSNQSFHFGYTSTASNPLMSMHKSRIAFGGDNSNVSFSNGVVIAGNFQKADGTSIDAGVSSQFSNTSSNVYLLSSNLGLGTSNPQSQLHVLGDTILDGDVSLPNALSLGGIKLIPTSNLTEQSMTIASDWTSEGSNLYVMDTKLGINTSNPQYPLDVAGDINLTGLLRQNGSPYVGSQFSNTSSNVFLLNSNLGLGKSNPQYPLDVTGDINLTGTFRQNGLPYVGSQFSNSSSNVFLLSSNLGINTQTPQYPLDVQGDINLTGTFRQNGLPYVGSQFSNTNSNVFLLSSNLGIGVSNPQSRLQVAGNILPGSNLTYDLGSSNLRWRDLYLSGNTINLGDTKLSSDGSNNIVIRDNNNNLKKIIVDEIQIGDNSTGTSVVISKNSTTGDISFTSVSQGGTSSNVAAAGGWQTSSTSNAIFLMNSNLGIGTSNPSYPLHVVGTVFSTADFLAYSDSNLKTNLEVIPSALDKVCQLTGYTFTRIDQDPNIRHAGLLAQDVQKVLPEVVKKDFQDHLSVSYGNMIALLVEAIKELRAMNYGS